MRMGYGTGSDEEFLKSGLKTNSSIRSIMADNNILLDNNSVVLDWGCATGRVLRHFAKEAESGEFWGMDKDEVSMIWAKANLAPPFNFLTSTAYPHFPFQDNKFSFIYGVSVFTHIEHLVDVWLMEFRRILRIGGYALFTVHDENTAKWLHEYQTAPWPWIPPDLDLPEIPKHDVTNITIFSGNWGGTHTFFKQEWIRKEWGRYLDIVEIRPFAEGYQSAVLLRKS